MALDDVGHRSEALVAILEDLQVGEADRSSNGITVYEEFDHTQEGGRSLGIAPPPLSRPVLLILF